MSLSSVLPPSRRSALIAFLAGALAVSSFAPFGGFPLAVLALALLLLALEGATPRAGFWRGWLFGVGLMGFGVFWIRISLNEFGNMPAPVAQLLTLVFVAAMALYYGVLGWALRRLAAGPDRVGALLCFPALYVLLEWLRGWLFTGFPWLALGYGQIDGPLAGWLPLLGVYGASLVAALSAGLLWWSVRRARGRGRPLALTALVVLWGGGWALAQLDWTHPEGAPLRASVVQANIPQAIKWNPETGPATVRAYLELTRDHLDADVVVWPETALPDFLDVLRAPLIDPLAERARETGTEIVLGIPVREPDGGRYYNALLAIGSVEDRYFKRHLVPFGEFLPFKAWLGPLIAWFEVPMSDFSRGEAARPLLQVGTHPVGASICYEDAFGAELIEALPEARYLINVSNDAWFGDSLAPHQHLQIARARALESGRDLLRATNTGISAIIDYRGRVIERVPAFVRGGASAEIQPRVGATPFARLGNAPVVVLAALMLALGIALARR
ncbi:apolipoprotein N-acyltransferase [Marichromatium sp. PS1]|uniref:apolipoprotein N-acyltransferase n=1 Tax=Marichromatium sp. PS1 TaxID=3138932 RepID=UPI0032E54523